MLQHLLETVYLYMPLVYVYFTLPPGGLQKAGGACADPEETQHPQGSRGMVLKGEHEEEAWLARASSSYFRKITRHNCTGA